MAIFTWQFLHFSALHRIQIFFKENTLQTTSHQNMLHAIVKNSHAIIRNIRGKIPFDNPDRVIYFYEQEYQE